jgi:hypothetical protein
MTNHTLCSLRVRRCERGLRFVTLQQQKLALSRCFSVNTSRTRRIQQPGRKLAAIGQQYYQPSPPSPLLRNRGAQTAFIAFSTFLD